MGNEQSSERPMINASTRTGKSFGDFQAVPKPTEATRGKVVCEVRAAAVRREEKFIFKFLNTHTHTSQINPVDYKVGKMILGPVVGLDFAGVVRHVAKNDNSHAFKVGDEVYGTVRGSLTPYCMVKSSSISHKPKTLSFAEAAALPTAYLTGFQGMFFFFSLSLLKLSLELTHTHTHKD